MWLVTGGAGYIGSHVVRAFTHAGLPVIALDDFSTGRREFLPPGVPLVAGDLLDGDLVGSTLRAHSVTGVIHLAGFKFAGVSVHEPTRAYRQNVVGTNVLLEQMANESVDRIVFSSSAAVYGTPDVELVTEATSTAPESPYGETKLVGEWMIRNEGRARDLQHTSLRYFNVVGSESMDIFDSSPHNLLPRVFEALLEGRAPQINGDDYDSPDGTCVRDYVHVGDVARAHVEAARKMEAGAVLAPVYNLGSGTGVSVRAIMESAARVTGIDFDPKVGPRRGGDPARIVASGGMAAADLGWGMSYTLDEMVASAWRARNSPDHSPVDLGGR